MANLSAVPPPATIRTLTTGEQLAQLDSAAWDRLVSAAATGRVRTCSPPGCGAGLRSRASIASSAWSWPSATARSWVRRRSSCARAGRRGSRASSGRTSRRSATSRLPRVSRPRRRGVCSTASWLRASRMPSTSSASPRTAISPGPWGAHVDGRAGRVARHRDARRLGCRVCAACELAPARNDRRRDRQFGELGTVEYSFATDGDAVLADLPDAFELHRMRWEGRPDGSRSARPAASAFSATCSRGWPTRATSRCSPCASTGSPRRSCLVLSARASTSTAAALPSPSVASALA